MTRGTDANLAFVFTTPPRPADPQPGTRPAPELDRYDRIRHDATGSCPPAPRPGPGSPDPREPIAVLADVLDRDGAELSASADPAAHLANADHLAILNAIWKAETRAARTDRYRDLVLAALPPGYRQDLSHQARWLLRTLRAAEPAGLDPADVIRRPSAPGRWPAPGTSPASSTPGSGARAPAAPPAARPWSEQVPGCPIPSASAYLAEIAAVMDDRKQRIGQHAAQTRPPWAVTALGPVPADPPARPEWQHQAAAIGAYRETVRLRPPRRPDRPRTHPRHAGQARRLARGVHRPRPGRRARRPAMPDGRLWLIRDTYAAETAWAPRHVGEELRLARLGAADADLAAIRAAAEADAARKAGTTPGRAARDPGRQLPGPARPLPQQEHLAQTMADRRDGSTPPSIPGTSPSPPTPNCAAATRASRSSPCAPPNRPRSATPNASI